MGPQLFGWSARLEVAIAIRKSNYAVGTSDVQELRIKLIGDPSFFPESLVISESRGLGRRVAPREGIDARAKDILDSTSLAWRVCRDRLGSLAVPDPAIVLGPAFRLTARLSCAR
jgi:hypothetical protein